MSDFDLDRLADVPDPLAGLDDAPMPPLRAMGAPSPTRSHVASVRTAAFLAALLYEVAWIAIMNKRDDLRTLAPLTLFMEVSIPVGAAVLALVAATATGSRGLGESKARLATLSLLAPAVFVAATVLLATMMPTGEEDTGSFWLHCLRCFGWTSLYAAGPFVLAGWAFQRSFVVAPSWRTAALAIACGASGAATMVFVCSVGTPAHVLIGHGGPMFVGAIVGALVGRRFGQI
jgi:hypothetical protein